MNVRLPSAFAGLVLIAGTWGAQSAPALADSQTTAAIVAGAAAITGALLYDASNHPYYVRNNHRYYVTHDEAQYYQDHHHGTYRRAYVPESEYPVAHGYAGEHGSWNGEQHH